MVGKVEELTTIEKNIERGLCGQKTVEYFKLQNTSNTRKTCQIVPHKTSKSSESRLLIQPQKEFLEPGKTIKFTLTYLPYLENVLDNLSYNVLEGKKIIARLKVHAKSVGPSVRVSTSHLIFVHCRSICQTTKVVEFLNSSMCPTKFCFDLDEDFQNFRVSPRTGILLPGVKLHLKFTFQPEEPGTYFKRIFCLLQFHGPVIFNLVGVCKPKLNLNPKDLVFNYPQKELRTDLEYESYMRKLNPEYLLDEGKILSILTTPKLAIDLESYKCEQAIEEMEMVKPVSPSQLSEYENEKESIEVDIFLTTHYVDVSNRREVKKATTLLNLSKTFRYLFQWNYDPRKHFRIEPCHGMVEPSERVEFDIYFTPPNPDILYHMEFDIRIFPYKTEEVEPYVLIDLPFTLNLRVIGNSFPEGSSLWIPQCRIVPKILHLPSCEPEKTVYGTFAIERIGHLPVNFVVVLPKKSNYLIQPAMGHFSGDFQLFVVQFKTKESGLYKEEVSILYDNFGTNFDTLSLVTLVETPELVFGEKNFHVFEPTFPSCRTLNEVAIENTTNLYLRYEFKIPEDITWVEILNPKGSLQPMGFGDIDIAFQPEAPDLYMANLPCFVNGDYGPSKKFMLHVSGYCEYGYLVATPSYHDFGDCIYGKTKNIKINLFNFSPVILNFRLKIINQTSSVTDTEKCTRITPTKGTMPGKGSMELDVRVAPQDKVFYQFAITSSILLNDSEEAFSCEDPKIIFSFTFKGVLPTFQVIDLNLNGGGPLFSPHWIWKMLAIDDLNKALDSLAPEEHIGIRFPEAMVGSEPITIALLIESNKHGPTSWHVKKKTVCSCTDTSGGICRHSKSVTLSPMQFQLEPKERKVLEFTVSYSAPDESSNQWFFLMPHGRKTILNSCITCLPNEYPSLSSMYLSPIVHLKPVYIGDPMPSFQMFWLYNNNHYPTPYVVDKLTLEDANAFKCVNEDGILPPMCTVPLIFHFRPTEVRPYMIKFNFCVHENYLTTILLEGEGVGAPLDDLDLETTVPEHPILYNANVSLECSVNVINLRSCRTFSKIKRLFFLRNRSETHAWGYRWHNFQIENLVSIRVVPEKGVVEPRAEVAVTLVFQSFSRPTSVTCSLPCDVTNYSKLKAYKTALDRHVSMMKDYEDYFTITQKGISTEIPDVPIPEKPESNHLFLTVNANIISLANIDHKLSVEEQIILKAGNEIECNKISNLAIDLPILSFAQEFLEKLLWRTLSSNIFSEKIKRLKKDSECNYLEILPGSKKETENIHERQIFFTPSKSYVQEYLENILREIVLRNFHRQN